MKLHRRGRLILECDACGLREKPRKMPEGALINDYTKREWIFVEGKTFCSTTCINNVRA